MRASTRRRITLALIGLLVLVLIGWFVQDAISAGTAASMSGGPKAASMSLGSPAARSLAVHPRPATPSPSNSPTRRTPVERSVS